jgi:hypothetical protein
MRGAACGTVGVPVVPAVDAAAQVRRDEGDEEAEVGPTGGDADALSPSVARAIAKRATETAFNLILEPDAACSEQDWDDPEFVRAMSLAAALRWSQHRVLLTFAENLKEFYSM